MERGEVQIVTDRPSNLSRRRIVGRLGAGGLLAAAAAIAPAASRVGAQETLSQDEGTALADRIVGRFNAGDLEGLAALFSPDVAVHLPFPLPGSGIGYLAGILRLAFALVPDASFDVDDLLIAEDRIVALATIRGTQTGSVLGVPATGTALEFSGIFVGRVAGGKVAELWGQFDLVAAGLQLANAGDSVAALLQTLTQPPVAASPVAGAPTLDELAAVPGVAFVLEFGADGSLVGYKSTIDIPQEEIEQAAKAGPTLNAALAAAARRYEDISALGWVPPKWVLYSGGDRWTAVLAGNHALFGETATLDFNALAKVLGVQE
jgi:roadblock/LC7 domain-containing protein/ketosteroid isomerase-like protein